MGTSHVPRELEQIARYVPASVEEAIETQLRICEYRVLQRTVPTPEIHKIAGCDAVYSDQEVIASVVVMEYPGEYRLCQAVSRVGKLFPYIPGLFAFREGRAVLDALQKIPCSIDMILFHGHGYAHPRRCGLASHIGVLIDRPSIGVAEHLLVGQAEDPGSERGATVPIMDGREVIGMAVRTREGSRPIYVSVGHQTDLSQAVDVVLMTTGEHRIPEPIRAADRMGREHRREEDTKPSH
jgi:deoxyribonuclease V